MNKKTNISYEQLQEWYRHPVGQYILNLEKKALDTILPTCFGYYLLQLGGISDKDITSSSPIHEKIFLQPEKSSICNVVGEPEDLPIDSHSIDVLVVNHILEFSSDPHAVLREIERVLRPEGYLILFSFNPWGWYGFRRALAIMNQKSPWSGHYFSARRIIDWLNLLGVSLISKRRLAVVPPFNSEGIQQFFSPIDKCFSGYSWVPMAGVNLLIAKKQVSTLTPIEPSWWKRSVLGARSNALHPTTRNQS